eukprot:TRINITY_DN354_c0_g2_i2.p1 TRINITY_DN354_c0_g2~~TRINITY_DN354_c0_g2_i2.p1  ORF type:complete len:432 (+),score=87.27 TRINITY_DN354_c0_g2_i2:170-1465(+)
MESMESYSAIPTGNVGLAGNRGSTEEGKSLLDPLTSFPEGTKGEEKKRKTGYEQSRFQRSCAALKESFVGSPVLMFWLTVLVCASTADIVFFKLMTDSMAQYPYFVQQMILFTYLPTFLGFTYAFKTYTPEMAAYPKWKIAVMGSFDLGATLLAVFGSSGTPGTLQTLFKNAVMPISMLLSIIFFHAHYQLLHYLGALTIIAGILVLFFWDQFGPSAVDASDTCDGGAGGDFVWWACLMFLGSAVPAAFGSIYKEYALKEKEMDVYYLNGWVAFFQFFLGMLLAPLLVWGLQDIPLEEIPTNLWHGALCVFQGKDFGTADSCGSCEDAWWKALVYICVNIVYNLSILKVMQLGSTVIMYVASTLSIPLSLFIFMIPAIEGEHFQWVSVVCLLFVIAGLVLYRSVPEQSDLEPVGLENNDVEPTKVSDDRGV